MRVICPECEKKAIITTTKQISKSLRHLYCSCSNHECGHTFMVQLSFSHTISPSLLAFPENIQEKIKEKSRGELKVLFSELG